MALEDNISRVKHAQSRRGESGFGTSSGAVARRNKRLATEAASEVSRASAAGIDDEATQRAKRRLQELSGFLPLEQTGGSGQKKVRWDIAQRAIARRAEHRKRLGGLSAGSGTGPGSGHVEGHTKASASHKAAAATALALGIEPPQKSVRIAPVPGKQSQPRYFYGGGGRGGVGGQQRGRGGAARGGRGRGGGRTAMSHARPTLDDT